MTFTEKVYEVLKKVPRGKVTTYKVIAEKIGTKSYQAVGQALKRNPDAPRIPCHRVVASNGGIGGYSGETIGRKIRKKISILRKEGIVVEEYTVKDFEKKLWK